MSPINMIKYYINVKITRAIHGNVYTRKKSDSRTIYSWPLINNTTCIWTVQAPLHTDFACSLPYTFLNNLFFSLPYLRTHYMTYNIQNMYRVCYWLSFGGSQTLYVDFQLHRGRCQHPLHCSRVSCASDDNNHKCLPRSGPKARY